jgi:hypothetical protein
MNHLSHSSNQKMDIVTLHLDIAREYNLTRKPVFDKFVHAYEGEIKYEFSRDYIVGFVDGDGFSFGVQCGITASSW